MKEILANLKIKYVEAEGEAAFYGPKLDIQYKDVFGKEDTLITIQIDFALPEKFDMTYMDKDGKKKRPMVIHRSSSGATERTMAYLLEKTQGWLKTWLAPIQVRILNFKEENISYARTITEKLKSEMPLLRIEEDFDSKSIPSKVKDASLMRVPYVLVVGDKEEKDGTVAVRVRGNKKIQNFKVEEFISKLREEIEERK